MSGGSDYIKIVPHPCCLLVRFLISFCCNISPNIIFSKITGNIYNIIRKFIGFKEKNLTFEPKIFLEKIQN